jgi:hypothetical protein
MELGNARSIGRWSRSRRASATLGLGHVIHALVGCEREPREIFLADGRGRGVAVQPGGNA